jgi:hypothetical protein
VYRGRHTPLQALFEGGIHLPFSARRLEQLAAPLAVLARHNAEQAAPAWPGQASVPVNTDKDLSQPDDTDDEYIE